MFRLAMWTGPITSVFLLALDGAICKRFAGRIPFACFGVGTAELINLALGVSSKIGEDNRDKSLDSNSWAEANGSRTHP